MDESSFTTETAAAAPPLRTLLLAILAPFGVIALMATPLLVDALRHATGS